MYIIRKIHSVKKILIILIFIFAGYVTWYRFWPTCGRLEHFDFFNGCYFSKVKNVRWRMEDFWSPIFFRLWTISRYFFFNFQFWDKENFKRFESIYVEWETYLWMEWPSSLHRGCRRLASATKIDAEIVNCKIYLKNGLTVRNNDAIFRLVTVLRWADSRLKYISVELVGRNKKKYPNWLF